MAHTYNRLDEVVEKKILDTWLNEKVDGGKIIYYLEFPAHLPTLIRVQMVVEHVEEPKKAKKKTLFS